MRILFTSDHHHHPFPAFSRMLNDGITNRLAEGLAVEAALNEIILSMRPQMHIRCGDLFDKKNQIDAVTFFEVTSWIYENSMSTEEHILVGNHDSAAGTLRNTLESLKFANAWVHGRPDIVEREFVNLYFVPYMENAKFMREAIASFELKSRAYNILITHCGINGAKTGSEFLLPDTFSLEDLRAKDFDQVFVGHVHEPQELANNTRYIGSFLQRNFSDVGKQRRALLLDTTAHKITEIPLPGPRFEIVELLSEEQIESYMPDSNTYYKIVSVNCWDKLIERRFTDYPCRGFTIAYKTGVQELPVRLSMATESYQDLCVQYVDQIETTLDRAELKSLAREIVGSYQ